MKATRIIVAISLTLATLTMVPTASAAPTIAASGTSAYAVTNSDYIELCFGGNTAATNGAIASAVITNPSGQTLSFTHNPLAMPDGTMAIRFQLDGTLISGQSDVWTPSGNLIGQPGDGTWVLSTPNMQCNDANAGGAAVSTPAITLSVGTKKIHYSPSTLYQNTQVQYWNWRNTAIGTTWNEPSTTSTSTPCNPPNPAAQIPALCAADTPNEAADEDPNNAYFFSDTTAPTISPFTAYTLNYGAPTACTTAPVSTVNGAWLGATGTAFSQFISRGGNFLGTADLRTVAGYVTTTEENEGATVAGTDSKSISYNNIAGTSYQFKMRDSTGEVLGAVQWIPSGLCAATVPSIINLVHNEDSFELSVSQAQCAQDQVSFVITGYLLGSGGGLASVSLTIYEAETGTPRQTITANAMHLEGAFPNVIYSKRLTVPVGAYVALAEADLTGGIGVKDFFDAQAFNVPRGECGDITTDISTILTAISAANTNQTTYHDHLNSHIHSHILQTAADHSNTTAYLDHLNEHLHATYNNIDFTRAEILAAISSLNFTIVGNVTGNFTIDNATLSAIYEKVLEIHDGSLLVNSMSFDGLGFDGSILTLLWVLALIWCLRKGKLMGAGVSTIGVAVSGAPGIPDSIQLIALLLFVVALWLEAIAKDRIYSKFMTANKDK